MHASRSGGSKVARYDGQTITLQDQRRHYELGGVYEAFNAESKKQVAIKILNPIGYKLMSTALLSRCVVVLKGQAMEEQVRRGSQPMRKEHVWWLVHPTSKQTIACYEDDRLGQLRELPLPKCIEIWGVDISENRKETCYREVKIQGITLKIPDIPKKFVKFATNRTFIYREIAHMSGLGDHGNVLRLDEALELVQDSKCTIFLVLELASGGELFDRIKVDKGTDEDTARKYFRQLLSGVAFCHASGVCHRDLKPENLLLTDTEDGAIIKIADFGLSAIFAITLDDDSASSTNSNSLLSNVNNTELNNNNSSNKLGIRRLKSVVGSPHYVAPEVLHDTGQGYDGTKADAWSLGVILYAMLAGNLPFGKDLLCCIRYEKFKRWSYQNKYDEDDPTDEICFPNWFFPTDFSYEVKSVIAQLLYPDPCLRLSVDECQHHQWVLNKKLASNQSVVCKNQDANPKMLFASNNTTNFKYGYPSPTTSLKNCHILSSCNINVSTNCAQLSPPSTISTSANGQHMAPLEENVSSTFNSGFDSNSGNCGYNSQSFHSQQQHHAEFRAIEKQNCWSDYKETCQIAFVHKDGLEEPFVRGKKSVEVDPAVVNTLFTSPPLIPSEIDEDFERISLKDDGYTGPPNLLPKFKRTISFESYDRLLSRTTQSLALSCSMNNRSFKSIRISTKEEEPDRPPVFHQQHSVKRSTRFVTCIPASSLLAIIEKIIEENPSPLPYPYKNIKQRLEVNRHQYQMHVFYGGVLTCSIRIFLFQANLYVVEFCRGQVDIFQFKRFYEDVREKISEFIKTDDSLQFLSSNRVSPCKRIFK